MLPRLRVEDTIYQKLLDNIKNGMWISDDKLPSEAELCKRLGVSRSSVRGAIQKLRALGIVMVRHGKGTYVIRPGESYLYMNFDRTLNLTEKEFFDITEFRESVEKCAIQLVAELGTAANLTNIEKAYLKMRAAAEHNDPKAYSQQDCLFHLSILGATQNDLIIQISNIFKEQYYNYFFELNKFLFEENNGNVKALFNPNDLSDAHTLIYEYLCKGNTACAQEVMNRILTNNKQRFMTYLREHKQALK